MMDPGSWLLFGGSAAALTFLAATWRQLAGWWQQLKARIIVSMDLHDDAVTAFLLFSQSVARASRWGLRTYGGYCEWVRPLDRKESIVYETVGSGQRLFWLGWRPFWLSRVSLVPGSPDSMSVICRPLRVTFLRGCFEPEDFLLRAVDYYNQSKHGNFRYQIAYCSGRVGKSGLRPEGSVFLQQSATPSRDLFLLRPLRWQRDELGPPRRCDGQALSQLALSQEVEQLVREARHWLSQRSWFQSRGLPWKRSYLLSGPPGSGKTSLVRALAEDLDLPVYVFDLRTLYNDELHVHWLNMLSQAPCIALLEDIDCVYRGRESLAAGAASFDCLLNLLDGVDRSDGLLTFLTTNQPETLDPALADDSAMGSRPGRVDRVVSFQSLDEAGRQKLCRRILADWPREWDTICAEGAGDTGAQFMERLTRLALQLYWNPTVSLPMETAQGESCQLLEGAGGAGKH